MADMMTFPDTVEEFMEEYKLVDTEQVYTNGMELVPIFRMKQWFEHEKAQLFSEDATKGATSDLISRQATIGCLRDGQICGDYCRKAIEQLPTIQSEPSIPLSWIEKYIEWLKSFDNEFANLEAAHISVMVKKWRDEQNERPN